MRIVIILIWLWGLTIPVATAQVVLTEIMFDAAGNENYDEFIEIVNLGPWNVDLSGWLTSDESADDTIISIGEGTLLQVGQYGIILDGGYLENSTYYDSLIPDEALRLTIDNATFGSAGLSNSTAETVSLINSFGTVVSSHTYTLGNEPGYSEEKIRVEMGDDPTNWRDSERWNGTPGAPNSVMPDSLDVALSAMRFDPENPRLTDHVAVWVKVLNLGIQPAEQILVDFGIDLDNNQTFDPEEDFDTIIIQSLDPLDSVWTVSHLPELPAGIYTIMAKTDYQDNNPDNNYTNKQVAIGSETGSVLFNELFYKPLPGQSEWVELMNPGTGPVNLAGWHFADTHGLTDTSQHMILPSDPLYINPAGYVILAKDSTVMDFNPPTETPIYIAGSNWPTLNNTGDSLMIYDASLTPIDSVYYQGNWSYADNGVSLERINPSHSSNNPLNWTDCVDPAQATPGRVNSVLYQPTEGEQILTCDPNPFSPDGDGRDDVLFIRYSLPVTTARVKLKIFDVRGRLVKWLLNNQPAAGHGEVIWDGTHGDGITARIGMYIIYLEAINAQNGVIETAKRTVVLAGKL